MSKKNPLAITEVVLRDAHQSLFATRFRLEDMLPIAEKLDKMGYWSIESWGGATFDSCIRYLGEDPWERIRALKAAMPNTPQQMLFRGQNILGYRHYADDVVYKFVERCAVNGVDVFRIFDAMNDVRNLRTAVEATKAVDRHAQGTISYTVSPVHTLDTWIDMGKRLEDMACDSICIKDMAGLLKPYVAEQLIRRLKQTVDIPIALHCHATTGLSTATILKASEAGVDMVDTSISSMSMTYGHSPTESVVAILQETDRRTGIDINELESVAAYFKEVKKKYARFAGSLQGVDARILIAQVPGGMLTNMENQLKDQNALDKMDQVLEEIPRVRKDLGYIPLVTPTSQIVGTQAVMNVMFGERYKSISKETAGVLKGEYGMTPAPVNAALQQKVLDGAEPVTVRPADLLAPEMDALTEELLGLAKQEGIQLADAPVDDVLTYALFPQVGLKFLKNRDNPEAFEPAPASGDQAVPLDPPRPAAEAAVASSGKAAQYRVVVNSVPYEVEVSPIGAVSSIQQADMQVANVATEAELARSAAGAPVAAPLSGTIFKIMVTPDQAVSSGDVLLILEAMKMETEVRATDSGHVSEILVKAGDSVQLGDVLMSIT